MPHDDDNIEYLYIYASLNRRDENDHRIVIVGYCIFSPSAVIWSFETDHDDDEERLQSIQEKIGASERICEPRRSLDRNGCVHAGVCIVTDRGSGRQWRQMRSLTYRLLIPICTVSDEETRSLAQRITDNIAHSMFMLHFLFDCEEGAPIPLPSEKKKKNQRDIK